MFEKVEIFREDGSPEHTFTFLVAPNNRTYLEVFLHNHHSLLRRVVVAFKYIFGYKLAAMLYAEIEINRETEPIYGR